MVRARLPCRLDDERDTRSAQTIRAHLTASVVSERYALCAPKLGVSKLLRDKA
jgi:hypothetical protein